MKLSVRIQLRTNNCDFPLRFLSLDLICSFDLCESLCITPLIYLSSGEDTLLILDLDICFVCCATSLVIQSILKFD